MRKRRSMIFTVLQVVALLAGFASVTASELKLEDRAPYQQTIFPAVTNKAGNIIKTIPKGWLSISLDGIWKFKTVPFVKNNKNPLNDIGMTDGFYKLDYNDKSWVEHKVPGSLYILNGDRADHIEGRTAWYRRNFTLSDKELSGGKRIVLDFRRSSWQTDVWVNGKKAGKRHIGHYTSFQYDITPLVKAGNNSLTVRVYSNFGMKTYHRRRHAGIYQPVRLLVVPTSIYANKMMLTTFTKNNSLDILVEMENSTGKPQDIPLTAELTNWKNGKTVQTFKLKPVTLKPGKQLVDFGKVKVNNPVYWSPENPHLYVLYLKDAQGKVVGAERFGFRDFLVKGEWFYLNGKKFKPRMFTFSYLWKRKNLFDNTDSEMEKLVRLKKELGVNMFRPHSMNGICPETFFNLCDEVGVLVYLDWSGPGLYHVFDKPWNKGILPMAGEFEQFIHDYYSHPSIVMWSYGNEIYEGHHDIWYSKDMDILYKRVKAIDKQNRPICSSSGRQTWEAMSSKILKEKTDVLDDHHYRGSYCGSWQDNIDHLKRYAKVAKSFYGELKPKVNAEYGVPGDTLRYRPYTFNVIEPAFKLDPSSEEFKEKYVGFLKSKKAIVGGYIRVKMNYSSPRQYIEETPHRRKYAERFFKRPVEIYRRAGTMCVGGHTNSSWYDITDVTTKANTRAKYGLKGPLDPKIKGWVEMPLLNVVKRTYNPTLVSAGVFNEHPIPGSKQNIEVFVTNDLNEAANFKVVAQLRLNNRAKAVKLAELDFGKVGEMGQKSKMLTYTVPVDIKRTVHGQLELYLFKNGKRVGDNLYKMTFVESNKTISTDKKVALYDSADRVFKGLGADTTMTALKSLDMKVVDIENFNSLDQFTHLIIGANSFDKTVIDAGEKIFNWLKAGGKILCFEQVMCGSLPFLPHYSITAGSPATFVSLSVPTHPAFKELHQDDFDSWVGEKGLMFKYAISPLDKGLVAVAPTGSFMDAGSTKSVLCDVKVGKGELILSQISATGRVDKSSVARKYLTNLINYFLKDDINKFAMKIDADNFKKALYVDDSDALFIDISKHVNRGFTDDKAGDKQGGWADFGSGFKEIPAGTTRLQGGVPFKIINQTDNNGKACIVLKGQKRPYFPEKVTGIPINALLNNIYVLHTSMYAKTGDAAKYVINYADGSKHVINATAEKDLPDWWKPADRANATVVFRAGKKGLYASEIVNPKPKSKIKSLDIISNGKSIPIIVGITGRKRFTSTIAGHGEK